MTIHTHDDAYEPAHTASQTAHALDELQLYGYRPFDEPDPRPMPDGQRLAVAVADIFDALTSPRPYKQAWSFPEAFAELRYQVSTGKVDEACVDALISATDEIAEIKSSYPESGR